MIVILHISYKKHVMETEYFAMSTHKHTREQESRPSAPSPLLKRGEMKDGYLAMKLPNVNSHRGLIK